MLFNFGFMITAQGKWKRLREAPKVMFDVRKVL